MNRSTVLRLFSLALLLGAAGGLGPGLAPAGRAEEPKPAPECPAWRGDGATLKLEFSEVRYDPPRWRFRRTEKGPVEEEIREGLEVVAAGADFELARAVNLTLFAGDMEADTATLDGPCRTRFSFYDCSGSRCRGRELAIGRADRRAPPSPAGHRIP